MSTRTERAETLRGLIGSYLSNGVTVTTDARDLDKRGAGRDGVIVLIVPGPRMEWPVPTVTRVEWTVYILANAGAAVDIWEPIDSVIDALIASPLNLTSAEPGSYDRTDPAPALPGYVLTIQDDYYS